MCHGSATPTALLASRSAIPSHFLKRMLGPCETIARWLQKDVIFRRPKVLHRQLKAEGADRDSLTQLTKIPEELDFAGR